MSGRCPSNGSLNWERSDYLFIALILLAVIAVIAFAVGGYLFYAACGRKDIDWLNEAEANKTPYGKFYKGIKMGHEWLLDHNARDVYTESSDGLRLHALWVPAENPKGTVVLVHGYRSCVLTDFSVAFPLYHEKGFNLLLPTQRSHGKSEGKYITFGVKESDDMLRWIAFHNEYFGCQSMIFSGMSMGASTVMYLAGEDLPDNVKGLIADCGFTTPKEIISRVFRNVTHIPAWTVIWATELFARALAHFSLEQKDTVKTLAKNTRPILLVHGVDDDFVPCDMTRRSHEACGGDKRLLLVEGAGHGVSFLRAKVMYADHVDDLLKRCLEESL